MNRVETILPLSPLQEGMLFHVLRNPLDCEYSVQITIDLTGALDVPRLKKALDQMVMRHPALRAAFLYENVRKPRQVILRERPTVFTSQSLRHLEPAERQPQLEKALHAERVRPFLLAEEPLLRMAVYETDESAFRLCATYHHIIADGWSMGIFWTELFSIYSAEGSGSGAALPEIRFDWTSFHAAQRQAASPARDFWLKALDAFPGVTGISDSGLDRARGYVHRTHQEEIDATVVEQVRNLARQCSATPASVYLAAWARVLQLYNDTDDVTFGNVVSGRHTGGAGIEDTFGLFINTVPLRVRVSGDADVQELISSVHRNCRESEYASTVPLAEIKRIHKQQGDYFDHVVAVENYPLDSAGLGGRLQSERLAVGEIRVWERSNYDLTLSVNPGQAFRLVWNYNEAKYSRAMIGTLGGQVVRFLRQMCEAPHEKLRALPVLGAADESRMVSNVPMPAASGPRSVDTLAKAFARSAREHAGRIAATCGDDSISYGELDRLSNGVARLLRTRGVKSDSLVGLLCERSLAALVGMVSIVKAGGAYLPMDPRDPPARLRYLIEDSGVKLLVCNVDPSAEIGGAGLERIDLRTAAASTPDDDAVPLDGSGDDLAYVIYTSGSTGRPKGVEVENRNVLGLLQGSAAYFDFHCGDVWTIFHSLSFDFSVWEIWGPLLSGGRAVMVPYDVSRDFEAFHRLLVQERVTVLNQTPSAFQMLATVDRNLAMDAAAGLALRYVIFGGEALDCRSLANWVERHGLSRPALINMYGITETTVHVTWHRVDEADISGEAVARIGRPLDHLDCLLVDRHVREVPGGVRGQILVAGGGVARGYRNRPELTAERFVTLGGRRYYCSGDLGRRLPDGSLQYHGRIDRQVKLRGFRIELSEIEGNLYKLPGVRQAAVLMREVEGSRNVLCAYVSTDQPLSVATIRKGLAENMPAYMVPSLIVVLDELPLTQNGKVNHRALPDPTASKTRDGTEQVPPRNEYERRLALIWAQVLGHESVGIRDSFFALGGDSILSIQIVYRAKEAGIEFSIQELFANPTIEELCSLVRDRKHGEIPNAVATAAFSSALITESDIEKLPDGAVDAYPLSALQEGMFFHADADPELRAYTNVGSAALEIELDEAKLRQAIAHVINRHPAVRTSFHFEGYSVPLQVVHEWVQPELGVIDVSADEPATQDHLIDTWLQESRRRLIDRAKAPLIHFQVHVRGRKQVQFSWVDNHAILDGWSLSMLVGEIFQAYHQLLGAQPIRLPALPATTFRDYIELERLTLKCESVIEFWRAFGELPAAHALPKRFGRDGRRGGEVRIATVPISRAGEIRALAGRLDVTPKSIFLAVHLRVLAELLNADTVMTGLVSNGRLEVDGGDQVVGLFLNTIPFRLSIADQTWGGLIREAAKEELRLLPYRRCPTAKIQQLAGREGLFETIFNYTDFYLYRQSAESLGIDCVAPSQKIAPTNYPYVLDIEWDLNGHLRLSLCYHEDWLSHLDAARVLGYYRTAIDRLVDDVNRPAAADLLSASEKTRLLVDFNATAGALGTGATLASLFARAAREHPQRVAVCCEHFRLTYAELERETDALAAGIVQRGEGEPENMIGIMMDRSSLFVIASLAVLKTGAAYVPIDPTWPEARIEYVVRDCNLSLVLTDHAGAGRIPATVTGLDLESPAFNRDAVQSVMPKSNASNLAYTIYTSGSTGRPKGVMMEHEAVVNTLLDINQRHGVTADDVILCVSSFCFDLSVYDIFGALACGATAVIAPASGTADGAARWTELIEQEKVTVWNSVPALMGILVGYAKEHSRRSALARLRLVLLSGDWIPVGLPAAIRECAEQADIVSMGGATEAAIWSIHYPVGDVDPRWPSIPYGRPLRDQQYFVLNREMQTCATNVPGALFIGGRGLARGYCNMPQRTHESFVRSPADGARLYRTGDLGRHLETGDLQFLGREDSQVKINGYRIELGEIEHVLTRLAGVSAAVASVIAEGRSRSLCAHVCCDETLSEHELRHWLAGQLPDYMVPRIIVRVAAFPLSPNGKIDRQALLSIRGTTVEEVPYVEPESEVARILEDILKEALGRERVGLDSNYFALGGDSITALRSIWKIRSRFKIDLSLETFLGAQTIRNLEGLIMETILESEEASDDVTALLESIETMPAQEVRERLASE